MLQDMSDLGSLLKPSCIYYVWWNLITENFPQEMFDIIQFLIAQCVVFYLLQIEQKFMAMSLISFAVFQRILKESSADNLFGSESNLAKSEFESWLNHLNVDIDVKMLIDVLPESASYENVPK